MSNQRFENSGSEDGQLRSPGDDDDFLSGGDEGETADSLDIKPPQAARISSGRKRGFKEKKHSRDHRHKDRDRDRERMIRDREKQRMMVDDRRHGGGRHGSGMMREHEQRHNKREHRDRHDQYPEQRERQREHRHEYHRGQHKNRERDKQPMEIRDNRERERAERDRRKQPATVEHHYETKADADRALEDLRSRLLSKRNKYEKELSHYNESAADYYESRTVLPLAAQEIRREKDIRERRENIEIIDSPEHYSDYTASRSEKKEKKIAPEDREQAARRTRLLEIVKMKEMAREELQARRELHRERGNHHKRHRRDDDPNRKHKRSRKTSPKEEGEYDDKDVIKVPDNDSDDDESSDGDDDDDDDDDDDEEEEGEADSDSGSETESNHSQLRKGENEDDDVLPGSPLSVGELAKSDRRRRSEESRSQHSSHSARSRSGTRSDHSRSRSHSSEERSRSKSRSRSRSRSKSRSSRSHSAADDDDDDELVLKDRKLRESDDDDVEMQNKIDETKKDDIEKPKEEDSPRDEKGEKLPNYYPGIQGCRSVEEFQCLNRIEEGTYGVVYRAKDKRTNEIVALKRLKMEKEKEGFPITSLREINTLLKGQHPNIVTVREIVVGSNMDKIFIVMDYVEHDLKSLMETMKHKEQTFFPGEVKCLMQQLFRAIGHLHDNWILHRDLKTSNLLLSHKGILKVGDFGLAREYGSPLKAYTSLVVTLWYRAPELLLCTKEYSTPIDLWSVGCIFAEFLQMGPLFPGKSEMDQLNRIFKELGTPNEKIWPGYKELPAVQNLLSQNSHFTEYPVSNLKRKFLNKTSELGISLLQGLLTYDPKQRLTAEQALKVPYFKELPLPIDPSMFPTWPAKSELGVRKALASSPKPPSGGSQFKQLGRDDIPIQSAATSSKTGFVLNANIDQRQLAMAPGFSLKF